jgi:anti-sigma B factor antagonist
MPDASPIRSTREGDMTCVTFTEGRITDEVVIHQFGQEVLKLVDADAHPKMLLDFTGVERVKSRGGQLRLCAISKSIFEVFRITRLDKLFQVHASAEQAKQSLA